MTTWGQAVAGAAARLAAAGIDESRLEAELLVAHLVGGSRTSVHLFRERELSPEQADRLEGWLARRERREPLAYVLGEQEFMGFSFACDARALVPRWDTEPLLDRLVAELRAEAAAGRGAGELADIGTGTGAAAISLALLLPAARVWAIDVDADALALAGDNVARHGVAERVLPRLGSLGRPLLDAGRAGRLDALFANLPYIPSADIAALEPEVREHEPRRALDGGADGLDLITALLPQAALLLRPRGLLLLEGGHDQHAAIAERLADAGGFTAVEPVLDLGGHARGTLARRAER